MEGDATVVSHHFESCGVYRAYGGSEPSKISPGLNGSGPLSPLTL